MNYAVINTIKMDRRTAVQWVASLAKYAEPSAFQMSRSKPSIAAH